MRKTSFITNAAFCTVLFLLTVACNKSKEIENPSIDLVCLSASQEDVKTHLGPTEKGVKPILWDASDEIWVRSAAQPASAEGVKYTTCSDDITDGGKSAVFRGAKTAEEGPYCAFYPYASVNNESDNSTLVFTMPSEQLFKANSFGSSANPAYAVWSSGSKMSFSNLCGLLKISLLGSKSIGSLCLESNKEEILWGVGSFTPGDASSLTFTNTSKSKNKVTVLCSSPVALSSSEPTDFYVVLPFGTLSEGFKLTVFDNNGKELKSLVTQNDMTISRSSLRSLSSITPEGIPFSGGLGTEKSPFLIGNAADYNEFVDKINATATYSTYCDKHYKQVCDIDLVSLKSLAPVGTTSTAPFKGTYDGDGYSLTNINITADASNAIGLFGYLENAFVKNVNVSQYKATSSTTYNGVIAGICKGSEITACNVSLSDLSRAAKTGGIAGSVSSNSKIKDCSYTGDITLSFSASNSLVESGGIAGYIKNTTVESCTFSGNISANGKRIGGIVGGMADNSKIIDCTVSEGSHLKATGDEVGGIVGIIMAGAEVSGCTVNALVSSEGKDAGGITGVIRKGSVKNCMVGAKAAVRSFGIAAGGVAGHLYFNSNASEYVIDNCLVCGNVQGLARVGGILGYVESDVAGDVLTVTNCGYDGGAISSTDNLEDNGDHFIGMGGVIGSSVQKASATINVINCWAVPSIMRTKSNQKPYGSEGTTHNVYPTNSHRVGGIIGHQTGTSDFTVAGCWSSLAQCQIVTPFCQLDTMSKKHFGGLYGKCSTSIKYDKDYCTLSIPFGPGYGSITSFTNCERVGNAALTDNVLLTKMNDFVSSYVGGFALKTWTRGPEGHPVISGMVPESSCARKSPLRISLIGDSISTFLGWLPQGYHTYYPASSSWTGGPALDRVSQTYWHRLAYDFMTNAVIDKNIAWSGSLVSALKAKHQYSGSTTDVTKQHYYGRSFVERFISNNGMGNPDIILIKGGTNDQAKTRYNTSTGKWSGPFTLNLAGDLYINTSETPSDAILNPLLSAGDAAKTYAQAKALPDDNFAESYIKFVRLCQTMYPKAKIVCIISDSNSLGLVETTKIIGKHYGCKVVDLYHFDGKTAVYKNPIMPKVDWTDSEVGKAGKGCHPNPEGMRVVAEKIYNELGSWLEEDLYMNNPSSYVDDFTITEGEW